MAKDRLHELKQTPATFQVRGLVTGTKSKNFYSSGTTKTGGEWNALLFGVQINKDKTVYIKLNGFPRSEVYYYKANEKKGAKGTTAKVAWKDRKKSPGEGYRLIGVNITTGKDEKTDKNINEVFVEYDAVEYLRTALKDGESVFVKGNVEFSTYVNKDGNVTRQTNLVPTQISYTQSPVNFDAEDFEEEALFDNVLVYSGIEKETDENNKETGRFILSGYSISYNDVVPVNFILDAAHAKLAGNLRKKLKVGHSIHTYGRIEVIVDTSAVTEEADDGWGESSKMERLNKPVRREYMIFKADPNSIDTEEYSEKSIQEALKKIKAAKEAAKNFGDNPNAGVDDDASDWGDDEDDGNDPW